MGTVSKAISLLERFSVERPEIGLSDLARLAAFDKATTRRLLVELAGHGLVEQDPATRLYRLGAGVLRLARIREENFPFLEIAIPIVRALAAETGETAHLSEYSARGLSSIHVEESPRANRVIVEVGQDLPLHTTASGIAFLSASPEALVQDYLRRPLKAHTAHTITRAAVLAQQIEAARQRGHSIGDQGYEEGVFSVAAPILGVNGYAIGSIAVASPVVRISDAVARSHGLAAAKAARQISERLAGGSIHMARKRA